MKRHSFGQIIMYLVALIFLGYHLLPVFSVLLAQINTPTKQRAARQAIADNATCQPSDATYPVLTYGNPMTESLYRNVPYTDPASQSLVGENLLPNPSFQTLADGWSQNSFGDNGTSFSLVPGHDGSPAARVQMSRQKSGEAKWVSAAVDAAPGQYFQLSHWYRSDSYTDILLDVTQQDGNHNYILLGHGEPTGGQWKRLQYDFVAPAFTSKIQVTHTLVDNGMLDTDNWKLVSQQLPRLQRGLVTLTFDDGWKSIYTNGLPLFDKYDVKTSQFIVSDVLGDKAYMNAQQVQAFASRGHEIASHTRLHEDLSRSDSRRILNTLAGSRAVLSQSYGWQVRNFASPYGSVNNLSDSLIKQCYQSHRGTDTGFNTASYDRYNLKVFNVSLTTKPEEISTAVRFARDHKLWVIFVYHEVSDNNASDYTANLKDLEKTLQILKEEQVPVVTYQQGLSETVPQQEAYFTKVLGN